MAKTNEFDSTVINHLQNIDEIQLEKLLQRVTDFTNLYKKNSKADSALNDLNDKFSELNKSMNAQIKLQSETSKRQQESDRKEEKNEKSHSENLKKQLEYVNQQNKDLQNLIKEFASYKKDAVEKMKNTADLIMQGNEDSISHQKKLEKANEVIQKENKKKSVQDKINLEIEEKHYKFQSEYYKKVRGKLDYLSGLKDFYKGFSKTAIALDLTGKVLGKALDGILDVVAGTAKFLKDRLGTLVDNIFAVIGDIKRETESIASATGRSFSDSRESLNEINAFVLRFQQQNKAIGQDLQKNATEVAEMMIREYGVNWQKTLTAEQKENALTMIATIKRYGGDPEEALAVAHGNLELQQKMLEMSAIEAKFRRQSDKKTGELYDAMKMSWEQAEKNGYTFEEYLEYNKKMMTSSMKASKNIYFNQGMASTMASTRDRVMSNSFLQNLLSGENVAGMQLGGLDVNRLKSMLEGGDFSGMQSFIQEAAAKNNLREIPALQELLSTLDIAGKEWGMLAKNGFKEGELTEDEKQRTVLGEEKTQLSSKSIQDLQGKSTIAAYLSAKESGDTRASEDILRQSLIITKLQSDLNLTLEEQEQAANSLQEWLKAKESGDEEQINAIRESLKGSQALKSSFEKIMNGEILKGSEQLEKDLGKTAKLLDNLDDLGIADAVKKDGIKGILTGILDASLSGAFSPEKKKKLQEFISGLGDNLKPIFNVVKSVLIDPILSSLTDVVGGLLGKIYAFLKSKWGGQDSEEEIYANENLFKSRTIYDDEGNERSVNLVDYNAGNVLNSEIDKNASENFKKAAEELKQTNLKDLDFKKVNELNKKYDLTPQEIDKLKSYVVSAKRGSLGDVITSEHKEAMLKSFEDNTKGDVKSSANTRTRTETHYDIETGMAYETDVKNEMSDESLQIARLADYIMKAGVDLSNESDRLRVLTNEEYEDYKVIKQLLDEHIFNAGLDDKLIEEGLKKSLGLSYDKRTSEGLAVALAKQNAMLNFTEDYSGSNEFGFEIFKKEKDKHLRLQKRNSFIPGWSDPTYYAEGGVSKAKKGGNLSVTGEAGFDEIIIPTDPDKDKYAQKLLQIAKDKYGVYLKDPDNVSDKLSTYVSVLGRAARMLMLQLDPLKDVMAYNYISQAFGLLGMIGKQELMNKLTATNSGASEEFTGSGLPMKGAPIENAPSINSIRNAIIAKAKEATGTPYKEAPAGFVCNELVNFAYGSVLGAQAYKEILNNAGYNHDRMHTISGFINEVGKNGFKGKLASSVPYSELTGLAKPGDLVFSSNTGKTPSSFNPDNHGHVNLYIDSDSKIDSTSMKINGKDGVGVHKPGKGNHMLIDILDLMPQEWYVAKGLIKPGSNDDTIIGMNADGTPIYANGYDPSLQSVPNASSVASYVSQADQAKIEKEKLKSEKENAKTQSILKKIVEIMKMTNDKEAVNRLYASFNKLPQSEAFCSVPNYTKTTTGFSGSAR